jgi:DNA-binding MarR family transcriptional regulator
MHEERLLAALDRLAHALDRVERTSAHAECLTLAQARSLLRLRRGPSRVSDLAREQTLAVSTLTRNLAHLDRRGWVQRRSGDEDKRTVWVALTEVGQAVAARLHDTRCRTLKAAVTGMHSVDRLESAVTLARVAGDIERGLA